MNFKHLVCGAGAALALLLGSCGGGDGGIGGTGSPMGTLKLSVTDAPSCGYDAVNITIVKVGVHRVAGAADTDLGWADIHLGAGERIDLLSLDNGLIKDLGQTALPAGSYTQLRLLLARNEAGSPPANSVVPSGQAETELTTPSAHTSGLKVPIDIEVPAGQVVDFVLDFDACKSIVKRGNSGQYNLKPVIRAIPRLADAGLRVVGQLDPAIAAGANVSLQSGGAPVKATAPESNGSFELSPVPAGTYDLVVTAAGRATAVVTGVPVRAGTPTLVSPPGVPIAPPLAASAPRSVAGTVAPATATVRALQAFSGGGPTVEVAWGAVDADSGAFQFSLTPDAPVRAAYVANPGALNFAPDTAAAGKYTVQATSGPNTQARPIDATTTVPNLVFTFP